MQYILTILKPPKYNQDVQLLHFNFLFPFQNIWNFDCKQKQWKAQQLNTNYFKCISPIYLICHYD